MTLARLHLQTPTAPVPFTACLPVPPDAPRSFRLIGPGGVEAFPQVDTIARNANGQPDTLLLQLARYPDTGLAPGTWAEWGVVEQSGADILDPPERPDLGVLAAAWGQSPPVAVVAEDPFGNSYVASFPPGGKVTSGAEVLQSYRYAIMRPTGMPGSIQEMPRFFGVHAWVTYYSGQPLAKLELEISNGHVEEPMPDLYFRSLKLVIPPDWSAYDVRAGFMGAGAIDLVPPLKDGKAHLFPVTRTARWVLWLSELSDHEIAVSARDCQGIAVPTPDSPWGWWSKKTPHLRPLQVPLGWVEGVKPDPQHTNQMVGPYPVKWDPHYGTTGGTGLEWVKALYALQDPTPKNIRQAHVDALHALGRERACYYDDGEPLSLAREDKGGWQRCAEVSLNVPKAIWTGNKTHDTLGFLKAPMHQVQEVQRLGLQPPYEDELRKWWPIDEQHKGRTLMALGPLQLTGAPIWQHAVRVVAEQTALRWTPLAMGPGGKTHSGSLIQDEAEAKPGQGHHIGRAEAWTQAALEAAYGFEGDDWRAGMHAYARRILDLLEKVQQPLGFLQSQVTPGKFQDPSRLGPDGKPLDLQGSQLFEEVYLACGLFALARGVFTGADRQRALEIVKRSCGVLSAAWHPSNDGTHLRVENAGGVVGYRQPGVESVWWPLLMALGLHLGDANSFAIALNWGSGALKAKVQSRVAANKMEPHVAAVLLGWLA